MAACQDSFSSFALEDEETVLAIHLAEALRADEVETFLEIYDSIPSSKQIKRVSFSVGMQSNNSLYFCKFRLLIIIIVLYFACTNDCCLWRKI